MTSSRDHVRLLAIFHYVYAGMTLLFAAFPAVYMVIGVFFVSGAFDGGGKGPPPPPELGWIFVAIGAVMLVFVLCYAATVIIGGRFLQKERHWTYCIVVAAVSCAFFPFGTVLGVFTILVLSRDEVKAVFAAPPPATPPGPTPPV